MAHHGPRPRVALRVLILVCSLLPSQESALFTSSDNRTASVPCLSNQASALLRLKRSFVTTKHSVIAFRSWRAGTDCCHWEGTDCNEADDGQVTSLDLGDCGLESGRLDPAVFELTSLRYLNLGGNDFNGSQLPSSGFERLTKLESLNLSNSNLGGQVPDDMVGRLTNLVILDLSSLIELDEIPGVGYRIGFDFETRLWVQNFTALVANLADLRELRLGSVDLSQSGEWCDALAKYTPNLRVLSMPFCSLHTPVCGSLSALHSLSVIDFQRSRLTGPFPNFFANLSFLSVLQLRYNLLEGWVSPAIFGPKKLVTIDLHQNSKITGSLPEFSANSRLQNLLVSSTNFYGTIPSSISNLTSLKQLGLGAPGFSGNLPSSIGELKSLNMLSISGLDLVGPIPSWITNLTSLEILLFIQCGLYGTIPSSIGHLNKLRTLVVKQCKATGEIPPHISNVTQLRDIVLSSSEFTGTVDLSSLWRLPNLEHLDLSNNKIVVIEGHDNSSTVSFPNIIYLNLASCSITKFPSILRHLDEISGLDLSNNQIGGAIPHWAWEKWTDSGLFYLIFSHNKFTSIGYHTFLPFFAQELDLSFNMFEGPIPLPKHSAAVLDYSGNMFSSISPNIASQLESTSVFKASRNNLSGSIPTSFCNKNMEFLDLSYNNFSGSIPSCLMEDFDNPLKILNLKKNQLHGNLPQNISDGCELEVLDISANKIKGRLPGSLAACRSLEVLDIGNNEISDSFPWFMSVLPRLAVLVLNSNRFFGQVEPSTVEEKKYSCKFPSLRILDIASNNFSGTLTGAWFMKLKSMMVKVNNDTLVMEYTSDAAADAYQVSTVLTYKGSDITIEKILLRTLAFLDVSNNAFQGSIPETVGDLVLLNVLNMSYNMLTGPIPPRLGRLNQLESLDLSSNELSGEIPQELAYLNFLTTLNLSNNNLVGSIPETPHFMTFTNGSFLGNDGLCGPQLSKECINTPPPNVGSNHPKKNHVDIVLFLFAGLGFGVGFAVAIVVAWGIPIRKTS